MESPVNPRGAGGDGRDALDEELFTGFARKLAVDTARYIPAAIIPALLGIASVSIFTRLFDSLEYGYYALVITTATFVAGLLSGWIRPSIFRYLPRFEAENRVDDFIVKLSAVLLALSLAALLLFLVVGRFIGSTWVDYALFVPPTIGLVLTEIVFISYSTVFQAARRAQAFTSYKIVWSTLRLLFAILYVLYIRRETVGLIAGAFAAKRGRLRAHRAAAS